MNAANEANNVRRSDQVGHKIILFSNDDIRKYELRDSYMHTCKSEKVKRRRKSK